MTTNAQGIYRFLGLPAGTYRLSFELAGFGTVVREEIRIGIGFTAAVDAKLSVKPMEEAVTVTGESPAIDTTATRVQTNFDKEQLDSLPNARDMWSLLAETPAVTLNRFDVGGSTAGTQTTYIAYGNGGQNRPLIEGINTTEGTSAAGFYFDYGSFDEVIIGAAGNSAEMPSGGVLTNFIGKSGGNKLSGEVYFEYENQDVQASNVSEDQLARGYANIPRNVIDQLGLKRGDANTLLDYKNLNASIGGPIIKDKLWFWAGYLRQQNIVYQPAVGRHPGRHRVPDQAGELHRQADVPDDAQGPAHRLPAVRHEVPALPHGRGRGRPQHLTAGLHAEPGVAVLGGQARVQPHVRQPRLPGGARR